MILTKEQQHFIDLALDGYNILVDACVGSGKTTSIQQLCLNYPSSKRILYLTYNKLLKIDAKARIKIKNVTVTNYHGFAYSTLIKLGTRAAISDLLQTFNRIKPPIQHFDILILDEYQDIDLEISEMLNHIKSQNPTMQIIAVGDMAQRIYDKTTLDVQSFIESFLGEHIVTEFTTCFRLCSSHAEKLGRIWNKTIIGANHDCEISTLSIKEVIAFLANQNPSDILCLGSRNGSMSHVLNTLEENHSNIYNKKTVYASIADTDSSGSTEPNKNTAIFTTFDSSKGLERKICIIFDFTESYWEVRINKPQQDYEILRNIFCVAASRGKNKIIFVDTKEALLSEETISTRVNTNKKFMTMSISDMFDFKYKEDVEECYSHLCIQPITRTDKKIINIENHDDLIDLAPCIGIYQEAMFFDSYDIDKDLDLYSKLHPDKKISTKYTTLDEKVLYLTSLETSQSRYIYQARKTIVEEEQKDQLTWRLGEVFTKSDESQHPCLISFAEEKDGKAIFDAVGFADVIKDDIVYELKYVYELKHEHFLQCASYMLASNIEKGILWNTRTNDMFEITIPNKVKLLDSITNTITKHQIKQYHLPKGGR